MLNSDEVKTTYKLFSDEPEVNAYKIHPAGYKRVDMV